MTDNTKIWDKLGKTDPSHTKKFQRAGGFKGTAIKPIYTEKKMTEEFGPCGVGWGIDEPRFETSQGSEGQVAVYCWVSIWVNVDGKVSAPIYGVGGDMVVVKQTAGLRTDDEAFKKAFTDAVGNAMKHLGMSADVHMGLFDDSKYVREREAEERDGPQGGKDARTEASEELDDGLSRKLFPTVQSDLMGCSTSKQLEGSWTRWLPLTVQFSPLMQENVHGVYDQMRGRLAEHSGDARAADADIIEADLRIALSIDSLKEKWSGWGDAMRKLGPEDVIKLNGVKEEMKRTIEKAGGKMPSFDNLDTSYPTKSANPNLTPEEEHAVKVAQTP